MRKFLFAVIIVFGMLFCSAKFCRKQSIFDFTNQFWLKTVSKVTKNHRFWYHHHHIQRALFVYHVKFCRKQKWAPVSKSNSKNQGICYNKKSALYKRGIFESEDKKLTLRWSLSFAACFNNLKSTENEVIIYIKKKILFFKTRLLCKWMNELSFKVTIELCLLKIQSNISWFFL